MCTVAAAAATSLLAQAALTAADEAKAPVPSAASSTSSSVDPAWTADPQSFFIFELSIIIVIVAFVVNFILGSIQNGRLARSIASILSGPLESQFAKLGDVNDKNFHPVRDGQAFFWLYATGRRHTPGLTIALNLAKRMDIFSHTSSFMSAPQRDKITMYLPISDDVAVDPMSLFVVKKRELNRLKDVTSGAPLAAVEAYAAHVVDVPGLPPDVVTMTEHADVVAALLPDSVRTLLAKHHRSLLSLHVTEQGATWDKQSTASDRLVRLEFVLPFRKSELADTVTDMCSVALQVLDRVAEAKLSTAAKKKAVELRKQVAAEKEKREQRARADAATARRLEKKKEEEEAVSKMSASKQRKYEEKKRKKEFQTRLRKASKQ